jgi:aminoglycoside phosphotransferase (APT) family kinase protein
MMLDSKDPGKVSAVFDWDMCTIGDPLADLGCLLSFWFEEGEGFGMGAMPSHLPGFMTRQEAVKRYGERCGRDISKIAFYHAFGMFKMAGIVQQIYYRYHKGQTQDPRFQYFGMAAEMLLTLAWSTAQSSGL